MLKLLWREREGEIIHRLINLEHDAKKGRLFLIYILHGVNGLIPARGFLLLRVMIVDIARRVNLNSIRHIGDEHSVNEVVVEFNALVKPIFHQVLGQLQEPSELCWLDDFALVVLV